MLNMKLINPLTKYITILTQRGHRKFQYIFIYGQILKIIKISEYSKYNKKILAMKNMENVIQNFGQSKNCARLRIILKKESTIVCQKNIKIFLEYIESQKKKEDNYSCMWLLLKKKLILSHNLTIVGKQILKNCKLRFKNLNATHKKIRKNWRDKIEFQFHSKIIKSRGTFCKNFLQILE